MASQVIRRFTTTIGAGAPASPSLAPLPPQHLPALPRSRWPQRALLAPLQDVYGAASGGGVRGAVEQYSLAAALSDSGKLKVRARLSSVSE